MTKTRSGFAAFASTGLILGLCLGFASCGEEPTPEGETKEQGLIDCSQCNPDNCNERCDEGNEGGVSQCTHKVPFCRGDDGFERPGDPMGGGGTPSTGGSGIPNCSAVRDRGCVNSGPRVRTGQFVKRECWGWIVGCSDYVYDTYSQLRRSNQCEYCSCQAIHVKRCKGGLRGGGRSNGSGDRCSINGAVQDLAVCR